MSMPHIRTMKGAYEEIREADPDTAVTFYSFRRTVLSGKIPSFREGYKVLINMAHVFEYYNMPQGEKAPDSGLQGQIRPVRE